MSKQQLLCGFLCIACALGASAEVYKTVRPDGTVVYSDEPGPDSQPIEVEPVPTIPFPTPTPSVNSSAEPDKKSFSYKSLSITSPAEETTFHNVATITVTAGISPALRKTDRVQLLSNGSLVAGPQSTLSFTWTNPVRGSHSLVVQVLNKQDAVIFSSDPISVYVHKASIIKRK